ncbi:MAG: hypothetical protein H6862_02310 [Rhodospirillales bacterium]|nr:hypothetical protein [Rhodospirillales bacterium]
MRPDLRVVVCGIAALLVFGPISPAFADLTPDRLSLFSDSAETAAKLDAIDLYCKEEKPGLYADQILTGAVRQGAGRAQKKDIKGRATKARTESTKKLKSAKPDCKDVEFMFDKYALLDKLDRQIKILIEGWRPEAAQNPTEPARSKEKTP